MNRKQIFQYSRNFIGGKPSVYAYYNFDRSKSIDIMTTEDSKFSKVDVHSTIGLSEINIGLTLNNKRIGVELISFGDKSDEISCNILATTAFEIMDKKECYLGQVLPNIIKRYDPNGDMKHIVLLSPVYWDNYEPFEEEKEIVVWLLLVPISDAEQAYIENYGLDAFEQVLMKQNTDVTDRKRNSFV